MGDKNQFPADRNELLSLARGKWLCGHRGRTFRYGVSFLADGKVFYAYVAASSVVDALNLLKSSFRHVVDPDSICLLEAIIVDNPNRSIHARGEMDLEVVIDVPTPALDIGEVGDDIDPTVYASQRAEYLDIRIVGEEGGVK